MSVRSVLAVLAAAACSLLLVPIAASSAAPAPSPWPQAGYNAAQSYAAAESTLTPQTIGQAVVQHTIAPLGKDCYGFRPRVSAPLLSGSRAYVVSGNTLASFDPQTGDLVWSAALPADEQLAPIAVSHGLVVVAGNGCGSVSDPLGDAVAFHAADGSPAWTLPRPYSDALIDASVSGDYLVVKTGEFPDARELSVYRLADAEPVWTVSGTYDDPDDHTGDIADASARVVAGTVFVDAISPFGFPQLQARALASGAVLWTGSPGGLPLLGDSDTADGDVMYDAAGNDLDPATGEIRFQLSSATRPLAVDSSRVYATCAPDSTIVCGYDRATGHRLWIRSANADVSRVISAGGLLYLSTGQVLNSGNGHLVRRLPGVPVAVGEGLVAVQRKSGALILYGLPRT